MIKKILLFFSVLIFSPAAQAQSPLQTLAHSTARLVSQTETVRPGQPFEMALLITHEAGWHSYWENPGEAGIPTTLTWTLPEGFTAGGVRWPVPELMREGPLAVYAYHGEIFLPATLTPPASLKAGDMVIIALKAEWLVCKEICIPESAELSMTLPVADHAPLPSADAEWFEMHKKLQPETLSEKGMYQEDAGSFVLSIMRGALPAGSIDNLLFLARTPNAIVPSAEQSFSIDGDTLNLRTARADTMPEGQVSGLLMIESGGKKKYFDVTLDRSEQAPLPTHPPRAGNEKASAADKGEKIGFLLALIFALLGGMILNLMPCVLPVLSLKALAVAKKSGREHSHVVAMGVAYTAGVVLSFLAIAAVLIGLQQAGSAVGWGYQMQSPAFVGFLIYLLFLVGLNLSGFFEMPVLFGNVGGETANESSARGSFLTGVLATAVATPCTAPFMASAVGAALTLPAWQALSVFAALGFGLALPFLLISLFPALLRFLPKPGAWMETFKQLLAFPMYGSAIWLLWVLTLQTGAGGMALALAGMLAIVAIIWLKRLCAHRRYYPLLAASLLALVLGVTLPMLSRMELGMEMMQSMENEAMVVPYSPEKLDALRASGTPVFVDATAAWCITCQVNAKVAIHTARAMQAFKDTGTVLMIADWTRQDASISAFLKSFGYQGVPLYVYYPPRGEPRVLPQLLSESLIVDTLNQKGE